MGDNGKRLRIKLPTLESSTTWRVRRSLRRFGRSLLQMLRPSCTRRNSDAAYEVMPLPTSLALSELKNHSLNDKVVIDDVGTIGLDVPNETKVPMNSICVKKRTWGTITFCITENIVRCEKQHAQSMTFSSNDLNRWSDKSNRTKKQILSLENGQTNYPMIKDFHPRVKNAFVATIFMAYCDHYPVELSVEDFWVAIAQGVSIHLNENAEKFRHLLVSHEGKTKLILPVDNLRISESDRPVGGNKSVPAINWPEAIRHICQMIRDDMKMDLTTLMTKRFSNTTTIEGVVFDCTLMDSVKSYYEYGFSETCGIPQVTLRGSPADFQELIDRVEELKLLFTDFHWWFDVLLPNLEKLKESAEGKPDIDWWQKICHEDNNGSGVDLLLGWLATFIPYKTDGSGHYIKACHEHHHPEHGMVYGIDFGDLEESITQTGFFLDDNGNKTSMQLITGFLGIGQNPETNALRPCLGWVTAVSTEEIIPQLYYVKFKKDTPTEEIDRIKQNIVKEGGQIHDQFDFDSISLSIALFASSVPWLKANEHIEQATLDHEM